MAGKLRAVTPYCKYFIFSLRKVCDFQSEVSLSWQVIFLCVVFRELKDIFSIMPLS